MLTIRADATPVTGAGHAMRCLNVAEAWLTLRPDPVRLNGEITLDFVAERAAQLGVEIVPQASPDDGVLVIDSYDEVVRQDMVRTSKCTLKVVVDDLGGSMPRGCDVVWNPNPYGNQALYAGFPGEVVTGPDAVPIRTGLPVWGGRGERVGVALGGGRISAPLGRAFVALTERRAGCRFAGVGQWIPITWDRFSSENPWNGLASCGKVVVAGGTMTWEAAYVGVPVVVVQTADNQERVVAWAAASGVPTIDMREFPADPAVLGEALDGALEHATPLPYLQSGSSSVARRFLQMVGVS